MYYIIDGIIFQAATIKSIIDIKLEHASQCIKTAYDLIHEDTKFTVKNKNPWVATHEKDDEFDFDEMFKDDTEDKANRIIVNALDSVFE